MRDIVDQANEKINQTTDMINTIRQTGEQTIQQVQKTTDSIRKAGEAITEVQNNITSLVTLSGATTESGTTTGTGK